MLKRLKFPAVCLLSAICFAGCANSGVKTSNTAENKVSGSMVYNDDHTITYRTGNAECDKAMADLDEAIQKVNTDPNSSPQDKNKAFLAELDKRSILKTLDDPSHKPEEKKQLTDKCREAMEQKIKELNSMK